MSPVCSICKQTHHVFTLLTCIARLFKSENTYISKAEPRPGYSIVSVYRARFLRLRSRTASCIFVLVPLEVKVGSCRFPHLQTREKILVKRGPELGHHLCPNQPTHNGTFNPALYWICVCQVFGGTRLLSPPPGLLE